MIDGFTHPETLEFVSNASIVVVALVLLALTVIAWRRERDRRMALVAVAFALFVLRGVLVLLERWLTGYVATETLEHAAPFLVAFALVVIFLAVVQR
ncbi:MAG: hypothetical protein ABEJ31_10650 [Haloarculaceae archaeon]